MHARLVLPFIAAALVGCATARKFPEKKVLDELAAKPAPTKLFAAGQRSVDRWELAGPFPTELAVRQRDASTLWEGPLMEKVRERPGALVASEDMHCAAREVGRFILAHGENPSDDLERFIHGRCAVTTGHFSVRSLVGEVAEDTPEARVFEHWKGSFQELLSKSLVGNRAAGVWFGRSGGKAVLLVASGVREAHVEPTPLAPRADGKVRLQGDLLVPAETIRAVVNQGPYGYAECEVSAQVKLPRFEVLCPTVAEDPMAFIDVAAFPPGRFLGNTVLSVLALPARGTPNVFEKRSAAAAPAQPAGDFGAQLVEAVNQVRKEANLPPTRLAPEQSRTAARVAPHYFAAQLGEENETDADLIALGMMAGWDIVEPVVSGHFSSAAVSAAGGVTDLVDLLLLRPLHRATLLDPKVRQLAVGTATDAQSQLVGAVVSSYETIEGKLGHADTQAVVARLNAARAKRNLPPAVWFIAPNDSGAKAAAMLDSGEADSEEALDFFLKEAYGRLGADIQGWRIHSYSLEKLEFPDDLVNRPTLGIFAVVSQHRKKGDPWAQFVVLIVIAPDNVTKSA